MFRTLKLVFPALLLLLVDIAPVFAQEAAYQIVNRWRETVIAAAGQSATEQSNNGLPSNQWFLEAADEGTVRFRSAATGGYLYFSGSLAVGQVPPTAREAMWRLEPVDAGHSRISNLAQPNIYLHTQPEFLEASPMQPNWWSAMWRLDQVNVPQNAQNNQGAGTLNNAGPANTQAQPNTGNGLVRRQQGTQSQGNLPASGASQQANGYGVLPPPPRAGAAPLAATPAARSPLGQSVKLFIQNRSNLDLDVFVDDDNGEQVFLATLRPNQQLEQTSPVGLVWRLAQSDVWLDAYKIEPGNVEQVIVFP